MVNCEKEKMDGLYVPSRLILDFVFCFFVLKFCFQIVRNVLFVKN